MTTKLEMDEKYLVSIRTACGKPCLYEGIAGEFYCFIAEDVIDKSWNRTLLREGEYKISGKDIEIIIDSPKCDIISLEEDFIEFNQIKSWWEKNFK